MKTLLLILVALLMASPAYAEVYLKGGGLLSNLSDLNTDNIGFSGEVGLRGEYLGAGLEVSNHVHLGDSVLGIGANGYLYPFSLGPVDPYVMIGVGASNRGVTECTEVSAPPAPEVVSIKDELVCLRDEHQPYSQAGIGAEWNLTDAFFLFGEGRIRLYHPGWNEVVQFSDYGDADRDTMVLVGGGIKF